MKAFSGRFGFWVTSAGCGIIALAGYLAISPALAGKAAAGGVVRGDATCHSSKPCRQWSNTSTGPGFQGASSAGNGLVGQTTFFSKTTGTAGVSGVDLATPNPSGTPLNNSGVNGQSATGFGVFGQTSSGIGVRALADAGFALVGNANGGDGVFGTTQSNIPGISSAGVFGEDVGSTSLAQGVLGFSRTGIGVQGDNFEAGKFLNAAFLGLTFSSSITTYFPAAPPGGLFNSDIGEGVVAESSGSTAEALGAANFGSGPVMRGYAGIAKTEVMELDNTGNLIIAGKLTGHGHPHSVVHTAGAGDVVMYSPAQAGATVEDVGEARLSLGETYVRIDPRFGATMNRAHPYLVFVTPQGDTAGLYVTQKTPDGFAVREHGGRSNIAFDYRIVGEPYGSQEARLPTAPRLTTHGFTRSFTRHKGDLLLKQGLIVQH
jgi:hypothetical protein